MKNLKHFLVVVAFSLVCGWNLQGADCNSAEAMKIFSVEDLQNIEQDLSGSYILCNDLDLSEKSFMPIGSSKPFSGTFEGNGQVIRNLQINISAPGNVGLFAQLSDARIKNLKIEGASVIRTNADLNWDNTGILAGLSENSIIHNIEVRFSLVTSDKNHVGAIAGKVRGGSISTSSVQATLKGTDFVGGVVGYMRYAEMRDVTSNVDAFGVRHVGGLVGMAEASRYSRTSSAGTVRGDSYTGGLVGHVYNSSISESRSLSNVFGVGNLGGLVGQVSMNELYSNSIRDCYSRGAVSAFRGVDPFGNTRYPSSVGGLVGEVFRLSSNTNIRLDLKRTYAAGPVVIVGGTMHPSIGAAIGGGGGSLSGSADSFFDQDSNPGLNAGGFPANINGYWGLSRAAILAFPHPPTMYPFSLWNFQGVWRQNAGEYPELRNLSQ